jgi:hypothetical protein
MNVPGCCNTLGYDDASIADMNHDCAGSNRSYAHASWNTEAPQNPAPEVGGILQLHIADFATPLTPYVPTWAHPYETFPEPNMGWLGELPPELFRIFMSSVPLADVAVLGCVSRSLSAILHSRSSPYASLLPLVEKAWTDDIDIAHVVRMLAAIQTMRLPLRPEALRAVASMLLARPRFPLGVAWMDTAWAEAITRTRDLVYEEIDQHAQLQMLVDLDVAAWHALDFHAMALSARRKADCWERMQRMPSQCWPPVLDAAVFRSTDLTWLDMKAIVADDTIRFPGISDRVAVAFAERPELISGGLLMADVMRMRFGVTLSQYDRLLRPMEAIRLATLRRNTNSVFSDFWNRYPTTDRLLIELTERVALEDELEGFSRTGHVRVPPEAAMKCGSGDIAALREVARWNDKFSSFYCTIESPACRSAEKTLRSDKQAPSLADAISRVVENLQKHQNFVACLTGIFSQPLGFQPVLLDRWAQTFRPDVENIAYFPLLAQVSAWRVAAVDAFMSRNEPINAVRACVAELRTFFNITGGNQDAVSPIFDAVTRMVFGTMPSETWGALLSYMNVMSLHRGKRLRHEKDALNLLHVTFLKNPRSELRESTHRFYLPLCHSAGPIFDELPDRSNEKASKFDNFCERIRIPLRDREIAKAILLIGIGLKIPMGAPHLCALIRNKLKKAGLHDDESLRQVIVNRRS